VKVEPNGVTTFHPNAEGKRYFLSVNPVQAARAQEAFIWLATQPK
jgi:hypothetical protein